MQRPKQGLKVSFEDIVILLLRILLIPFKGASSWLSSSFPEKGGVLLGILGGVVPPCSPDPDPISDQKMSFSTPVFKPGLYVEKMSSLLRLESKQKKSSNPFRIRMFLFFSCSFGVETISTFIHSPV